MPKSSDKCPICRRMLNQHSLWEFCPATDGQLSVVGTYTIVKNSARYPGIGWEFPESFQVAGMSLHQAKILADSLTNREAGCDWAYFCKEDMDTDPQADV